MRHYPEVPPPGLTPNGMNKHLQPLWCDVRNAIVKDQQGVQRCLEQIKANKHTIKFLQERIIVQKLALDELGKIQEKKG